jgi:hypothetical protein
MAVEKQSTPVRLVSKVGEAFATAYEGRGKVSAHLEWDPTRQGYNNAISDMTIQQAKDLHQALGDILKELE